VLPHARIEDMSLALDKPMTLAQFLAWEERQAARYEFDGFHPVAMAGERWRIGVFSGISPCRSAAGSAGSPAGSTAVT
jgi:hypothetical protein